MSSLEQEKNKETFSKSEFFEKERSRTGKYPKELLKVMRKEIFKTLRLSMDPHEQGHYFRDRMRRWWVRRVHGMSDYKRVMRHIVYHLDTIDFKDDQGVEQVKFSRKNAKPTKKMEQQTHAGMLTHDNYHYFTRDGINWLLEEMEAVRLGDNFYRPQLLGVEELQKIILPQMPGETEEEHIVSFAKLMRMQPLGYWKGNEAYFSEYAVEKPDKEKNDKKSESGPVKTIPHCWYPLKNDLPKKERKKKKDMWPYFVAGRRLKKVDSEFNRICWLPKDETIATPLRCKLVRIDDE